MRIKHSRLFFRKSANHKDQGLERSLFDFREVVATSFLPRHDEKAFEIVLNVFPSVGSGSRSVW